jgi:2-polyprenyl-3-methyl-5-hydroxy-6-metoxy-1,4-benzoquinol methylase
MEIKLKPESFKNPCYCCNNNDWLPISGTNGGDYYKCNYCNHQIQVGNPNINSINKFEDEQKKNYDDDTICLSPLFTYLQIEATEKRFELINKYLKNGSILEVGPGNGDVIKKALTLGYKIEAVEHSKTLALAIQNRLGINVRDGAFESCNFDNQLFDAYMSFHVIEHIPDVLEHLNKSNTVVKDKGWAFIATPNAASLEHKIPFNLSPNFSSAHLQLFTPKSLKMCLKKAGWEVVYLCTPVYTSSWLRIVTAIIRKIKGSKNAPERGEYMKSTSSKTKLLIQVFSFLSKPFRKSQEMLGLGNELYIVARKI